MGLMMTRGSDPAERRSPPELTTWRCLEVACGLWRLEAACYRAVIAVEEEGEPKDPVVEAALDQGRGTRTRGLGGLLTDFSTLKEPTQMMSKTSAPSFTQKLCYINLQQICHFWHGPDQF